MAERFCTITLQGIYDNDSMDDAIIVGIKDKLNFVVVDRTNGEAISRIYLTSSCKLVEHDPKFHTDYIKDKANEIAKSCGQTLKWVEFFTNQKIVQAIINGESHLRG